MQVSQFHREKASLQTFQPEVVPGDLMFIFSNRSMVSQHSHPLCKLSIVGDDRAAFPKATKILARIETETSRDANRARHPLFVGGAMGLARVFNQVDVVSLCDFLQSVEIGTLPVKMHGQKSSSTRRNSGFHLRRIHVIGNWIDVYKYRARTDCADCLRCSNESVWNSNNFVPRTDAQSQQNELQRGRAGIYRDAFG